MEVFARLVVILSLSKMVKTYSKYRPTAKKRVKRWYNSGKVWGRANKPWRLPKKGFNLSVKANQRAFIRELQDMIRSIKVPHPISKRSTPSVSRRVLAAQRLARKRANRPRRQ